MPSTTADRKVLRALAAQVAEIAALPDNTETIALWKALNGLRPVRPMVAMDQLPWHEMEVDGELTLQCEDKFCRRLETRLRRTLYRWRHMRADMVVEPFVEIGKAIRSTGFGYGTVEDRAIDDPRNDVVGHYYHDQIKTDEDIARIHAPEISLDEKATAEVEERAHDIYDGLLEVRMEGQCPVYAPWDILVQWHNPEQVLMDMVERPDFLHRMAARLTRCHMEMLDQMEQKGLLGSHQDWIHCTGAFTDELPAPGFDESKPRARDLWTFGMSQMFAAVSPAMHEEFELPYLNPWFERFGLGYYGCCEPLDRKIDMIRKIPHVRKVSMSPWVDLERGAEGLGRDFVFSRKPSPAFLAWDDWDPEAVERDLRATYDACARHGCPLELILKDVSTVRYEPQRLWQWSDIAMRVATDG
jgi:hypothetical protein